MRRCIVLSFFLIFACDIVMDSYCAVCCQDEMNQPCAACIGDVHNQNPIDTVAGKAPDAPAPRLIVSEVLVPEILLDKSLFHPPVA